MGKLHVFIVFMLVCATLIGGCTGPAATKPTVTPTSTPEPTPIPAATVTVEPTIMPTATAIAETATPVPTVEPVAIPSSGPIYTMSCTFTHIEMNVSDTVITDIDGSLTDRDTGKAISGTADSDAYDFTGVSAGRYDLAINVQYTVDYANGSTADHSTRITDSFDVNGNVDKTYPLE